MRGSGYLCAVRIVILRLATRRSLFLKWMLPLICLTTPGRPVHVSCILLRTYVWKSYEVNCGDCRQDCDDEESHQEDLANVSMMMMMMTPSGQRSMLHECQTCKRRPGKRRPGPAWRPRRTSGPPGPLTVLTCPPGSIGSVSRLMFEHLRGAALWTREQHPSALFAPPPPW